MTYPFFTKILEQLNRVLRFDATVAYAGNSFVQDSSKMIEEHHPFYEDKQEVSGEEANANRIRNFLKMAAYKQEHSDKGKGNTEV